MAAANPPGILLLLSAVLCGSISDSQTSSVEDFNYYLSEQVRLLNLPNISAIQQIYSAAYEGLSRGDAVNGLDIVTTLARQLAEHLEEVASAVRALTVEAGLEYSANFGKNCCSEQCVGVTGVHFSRDNCSGVCPGVQGNGTFPELNFYRSEVPMADTTGQFGVFMDVDLQPNAALGRSVDLNDSALHYPVDIYDRDPHVLCFAEWSHNLTQYFIDHGISPVTGSVQFQFFATESGALRFYPAFDWMFLNKCHRCPLSQVDSYDSRFRPWYVNTVSGTKFLIIVMDLSGSMTGFRLLLAKLTAKELLLSLSQNDYFLVLKVGGENKTDVALTECFSKKTRASPENILTIVEIIDGLSESVDSTGSYEGVVSASLSAFGDINSSAVVCHKLLVFLTDRDVLISDLTSMLNRDSVARVARIIVVLNGFARSILQENILGLKQVTCESGGFVELIQTYSNINNFMLNFTEVLRSQTVANASESAVFWNHYKDFTAGIVLSCSQPLYSKESSADKDSRTFVGVGGIDVNLTLLQHYFQQYDLGPYGYGFIVDNNGQLLLHPLINLTYIDAVSGDDLIALDVSNFEQPVNRTVFNEVVREAMLNRSTGSSTTEAWVAVGGQRSEFRLMNVTYYYAPINGTPFSLAIVVPESVATPSMAGTLSSSQLNLTQLELLSTFLANYSQSFTIHLLRPICNVSEFSPKFDTLDFIQLLIRQQLEQTSGSTNITNCTQQYVNNVLHDLWVSTLLMNETTLLAPTSGRSSVLEFPSGLVVASDHDGRCRQPPVTLSTRSAVLDFALQENTSQSFFYNTACGVSLFRVLEAETVSEGTNGTAGLAQPLNPASSAIYGEQYQSLPLASSPNSTILLVLGRGRGLVLNSTNSEEVGQYFADLYPHVFNDAMSEVSTLHGFEVRPCSDIFRTTTECSSSGAYSVYKGVLLSVVSGVWWVLSGGPLLSLHVAMTSLYASLSAMMSSAQQEAFMSCPVRLCDHKVPIYQWPRPPFNHNGMALCYNDTTDYTIGAVPGTNLFLIELVGQSTMCNNNATVQPLEPVEYSCPCSDRGEVYRVAPPYTTASDICDNNKMSCSNGVSSLVPTRVFIVLATVLSIYISATDTLFHFQF